MEATLWRTKTDAQSIFKQLIFSQVTPPELSLPRLFCLTTSRCVRGVKKTPKKIKEKRYLKDEATDEIENGIKGFFFF